MCRRGNNNSDRSTRPRVLGGPVVVCPEKLSVESHQQMTFALSEAVICLDGLSHRGHGAIHGGRRRGVSEKSTQGASVEVEHTFELLRRVLAGGGLPHLPLGNRPRRHVDEAGE